MIAEVLLDCGRYYLKVAGIVLAMEGDKCRDGNIPESVLPIKVIRCVRGHCWTKKMLEWAADKINGKDVTG